MSHRLITGYPTDPDDGWLVSKTRCLKCLQMQINVYQDGADEHSLQCAFCGERKSAVLSRVNRDKTEIEARQDELN